METYGIGIVTCNRQEYLLKCLNSIKVTDAPIVIVNDSEIPIDIKNTFNFKSLTIINHKKNKGVGISKNDCLRELLKLNCDYLFLIEDDMVILDNIIFKKYIEAYKKSGIHHFNYGPGSPFNRKQTIQNYDLHNRHLLDQKSEPNPKLVIDYGDNIKISLFEHTVAMFSFFTRECLEKVGLIDEEFYNAWEHVDHTYRIIQANFHPPFWWFADIHNSHLFLTEAPGAIDNSSIANKQEQWYKNVYGGREIYKKKHGIYPNQAYPQPEEYVVNVLKQLKQK